jgi:hypothetical protein
MKKFSILLILAFAAMTIMAFPTPGHADTRKAILQIEGMICIA